jgi:hypothetical protein
LEAFLEWTTVEQYVGDAEFVGKAEHTVAVRVSKIHVGKDNTRPGGGN